MIDWASVTGFWQNTFIEVRIPMSKLFTPCT